MAVDRTKTTLSIALIVFVMLSFVLGITTYVFSSSQAREAGRADAVDAELAELKRQIDSQAGERDRFRDVIGTGAESIDEIEAERTETFEQRFGNYESDQRTYRGLVDWLAKAVSNKDEELARAELKKAEITADTAKAVAAAEAARDAAEKARAQAEQTLKQEQEDFQKRRADAERQMEELSNLHKQALASADQMRAITEEIEKLGPVLGPDLRRRFTTPVPEGETRPWPEMVRDVRRELDRRQRQIRDLNETLTRLRVADENLQKIVRDATPADDRIDGFDGRVVSVNAAEATALVLCPSTNGLRPGTVLFVYDPADPRPEFGARKGTMQVVEVESPTLARARVVKDSAADPILSGDGVATSLWSPGGEVEVVLVGFVRIGDDPAGEANALRTRIERAGARVADTVSPQTALVVDAGVPDTGETASGAAKTWNNAAENRRAKALERAKELGLRVTGLAGLLEMLGLDVPTAGAGGP